MHIKKLITFIIFTLLFFLGCDKKEKETISEDSEQKSIVVKKLKQTNTKNFKLQKTDGSYITIINEKDIWKFPEYPNKIVLLNSWATWCPPCKAKIPHLNNLVNKYKNDFVVIGVLVEENKGNEFLSQFIKDYNIQYPITNDPNNFILAKVVGGVSSIPALYIYDKTGKQVRHYVGTIPEEVLDNDIKKIKGN